MKSNLNDIEKLVPLEPSPWLYEKIQRRILDIQEEYASPGQLKWVFFAITALLIVNISVAFFTPESKSIIDAFQLNDTTNNLYP